LKTAGPRFTVELKMLPIGMADPYGAWFLHARSFANFSLQAKFKIHWLLAVIVPLLVLCADVGQRIFHHLHLINDSSAEFLRVSNDYSLAEFTGNASLLAAIGFLVNAMIKSGDRTLGYWAFVVSYITFDDMIMLHDRMRGYLGQRIFYTYETAQAAQYGETLFFSSVISLLILLLVFTFWRASWEQWFRGIVVGMPLAAFFFFSVIYDGLVEVLLYRRVISDFSYRTLTMVEDEGELVASTFVCLAAFFLLRHIRSTQLIGPG
jgi:hypothetical protein